MKAEKVIYSNCSGKLIQNDVSSNYSFYFLDHSFTLSPKELRLFTKHIKSIDLKSLFASSPDVETIYYPELDVLLVLSITELIYLKDLVLGSQCMLELNSILEKTMYCPF